jgi:exopolysaccharide biosynthesis WecB/TagA/CpsF family protein
MSSGTSADLSTLQRFPPVPTEIIGGVNIATMTRQQTARLMADIALSARGNHSPAVVFSSVNGQVLSTIGNTRNSDEIADLLGNAYVVSADGQPLVFASQLLGDGGLRQQCATTDLFHDVAEIAVSERITFYMLGASRTENSRAVENVKRRFGELQILGHRHGYFDNAMDERRTVEHINALKPDILWVALGFPREQEFCNHWRHALTDVGILKTSGGLFNFLSGTRRRAPEWMQAAGLEWAFRLYLEPRRLFLRYLTTNLHATWLLLTKTERQKGRKSLLWGVSCDRANSPDIELEGDRQIAQRTP